MALPRFRLRTQMIAVVVVALFLVLLAEWGETIRFLFWIMLGGYANPHK